MFRIEKEFQFCAGHYLRHFQGECARQHGHNYVVVLVLESEKLQGPGFVRPFRDLDRFKRFLEVDLDHRNLNDLPPFDELNPTTEHLTEFLFWVAKGLFPELTEVRVSETPKTWVTFRETHPVNSSEVS